MGEWRIIEEDLMGKVRQTSTSPPQAGAQQGRRKGIGVKTWIAVAETGESRVEEVEKQWVMRRTGVPARDLRVLDPVLSHPSSILGRERAIVVNLEHIKGIITASEVLMINSNNPLFIRFLQDLKCRLPSSNTQTPPWMSNDEMDTSYYQDKLKDAPKSLNQSDYSFQAAAAATNSTSIGAKCGSRVEGSLAPPPPKPLPFEFKALEACLESACRCLDSDTHTLEKEAYPALDELTSHISTLNLERVRQIKSRLVALSGRVHKVKDQLEHLLDDDSDMAEMYLSLKLEARSSLRDPPTLEFEDDQRSESYSENSDTSSYPKIDVEELEMLLEAYFAQINGILQKLSSLSEYVDDTEDCINISLDDKRNQMLQAAVIFNLLNMILNAGIVAVGLFGMNIHIDLFDGQPKQFWATAGGTLGSCLLVFFVSFCLCKKRYMFLT